MSFSLHSSTENFGRRAQVLVVRIELQLELKRLGEVLDRADVAEGLGEALVRNHSKDSRWIGDEIGQLERLDEVGERIPLAGAGREANDYSSKVRG